MPEPHTLFTVVAPVASGKASAAGSLGAPGLGLGLPANTQPIRTSSMRSGLIPGAFDRGLDHRRAEARGQQLARVHPGNGPSGVRTDAAMTIGSLRSLMVFSYREGRRR